VIGDAHVYKNHVEALKQQLERQPLPFPKLKINTSNKDIDGFSFEDLELIDYQSHGTINMVMSV
jgi:thymidylate synthase